LKFNIYLGLGTRIKDGEVVSMFEVFEATVQNYKEGAYQSNEPDGSVTSTDLRKWFEVEADSLRDALREAGGRFWREVLERDMKYYVYSTEVVDRDGQAIASSMTVSKYPGSTQLGSMRFSDKFDGESLRIVQREIGVVEANTPEEALAKARLGEFISRKEDNDGVSADGQDGVIS